MIINPYVFGGFDADAQAFITAAGITDNTQKTAINTLVLDMKGYGIWTKMKAIYPFVGGTATTHKWNLKNPLDTNAAFRLVFNGGITHTSNGIQGNAVNGWANTFLAPSTLTNNSTHISIYSRTDIAQQSMDIGVYSATFPGAGRILIFSEWIDNNLYSDHYNENTNRVTFANASSQGFYISNRTASNVFKVHKNASIGGTNTNASTPSVNTIGGLIAICSGYEIISSTANQYFSSRQYAFASIGDGLTDTEAANFYTAVQAYQTTLGRQV